MLAKNIVAFTMISLFGLAFLVYFIYPIVKEWREKKKNKDDGKIK
jgi:threonine/homoserine/homoserine lactone efflux protein